MPYAFVKLVDLNVRENLCIDSSERNDALSCVLSFSFVLFCFVLFCFLFFSPSFFKYLGNPQFFSVISIIFLIF